MLVQHGNAPHGGQPPPAATIRPCRHQTQRCAAAAAQHASVPGTRAGPHVVPGEGRRQLPPIHCPSIPPIPIHQDGSLGGHPATPHPGQPLQRGIEVRRRGLRLLKLQPRPSHDLVHDHGGRGEAWQAGVPERDRPDARRRQHAVRSGGPCPCTGVRRLRHDEDGAMMVVVRGPARWCGERAGGCLGPRPQGNAKSTHARGRSRPSERSPLPLSSVSLRWTLGVDV